MNSPNRKTTEVNREIRHFKALELRRAIVSWGFLFASIGWILPSYLVVWLLVTTGIGLGCSSVFHTRMVEALALLKRSRGNAQGFVLSDAESSDYERSIDTDLTVATAYQALLGVLEDNVRIIELKCEKSANRFEALVVRNDAFSPVRLFAAVSPGENQGARIFMRGVSHMMDYSPDSFFLVNTLANEMLRDSTFSESATHNSLHSETKWFGKIAWNRCWLLPLSVFVVTSLLSSVNLGPNETKAMNNLKAGHYEKARDCAGQLSAVDRQNISSINKYEALMGLQQFEEAIQELDPKVNQEFVALAKIEQKKFSEAESILSKIPVEDQTMDTAAQYLAKAEIAAHKQDRSAALEALAIASNSTSQLERFGAEKEISLLRSLGNSKRASELQLALDEQTKAAEDSLDCDAKPGQFSSFLAVIFGLAAALSWRCHRFYNRGKVGYPVIPPVERSVLNPSDCRTAFDNTLHVLRDSDLSIIGMEEDEGVAHIDAVGAEGAVIIKLEQQSEFLTKISVLAQKASVTGDLKQMEDLREALAISIQKQATEESILLSIRKEEEEEEELSKLL